MPLLNTNTLNNEFVSYFVEAKPKKQAEPVQEAPVDVSRLDMRIGKIIDVKKHSEADTLYVEEVDLGEGRHRTVVSGLVNHIPIEQVCFAIHVLNLIPPFSKHMFFRLCKLFLICKTTLWLRQLNGTAFVFLQ